MPNAECRIAGSNEACVTAGANDSATGNRQSAFLAKLALFASDIKLHHTVFALPFALLSAFLAAGGVPAHRKLLLILICMVTARTVAMSANRLLDAQLDAANPRTARRAIPSGELSKAFFGLALGACAAAFVAATGLFQFFYHNPWPLVLSLPVLLFIGAYPLLKRFTRLCHYYLGASLALAPVCAWIAIKGNIELPPTFMFLAVLFWTAGFDIIYACQDYEADVHCGVFSVPAKLGVRRALWVARLTHVVSVIALILLGFSSPHFSWIYFAGVALAAILLVIEHWLVTEDDLSKLGMAFFMMNGILSVAVGTLGIVDVLLGAGHR